MSAGIKFDGKKPRTDLWSPIAFFAVARVLTVGAAKYASRNWELGFAWTRAIAAILRHTFAYMLGQTIDKDTGESHMACVACEAMFLLHFEQAHPDLDDRPKYGFSDAQIDKLVGGVSDEVVAKFLVKTKPKKRGRR